MSGKSIDSSEFTRIAIWIHQNGHSSPRIQPYAMILKWRGVPWCALSTFRGLGANASPHARQSCQQKCHHNETEIRETNLLFFGRANIDLPLFGKLGQTSQDSCVSDRISTRSRDVWPNSPKSDKSILSLIRARSMQVFG